MNLTEVIAARDLAREAYNMACAAVALLDETTPDEVMALAKATTTSAWALFVALNNEAA